MTTRASITVGLLLALTSRAPAQDVEGLAVSSATATADFDALTSLNRPRHHVLTSEVVGRDFHLFVRLPDDHDPAGETYQPVANVIPHPAALVRPSASLPDLDESTDSTAARHLDPNRTSTTGYASTFTTDCYPTVYLLDGDITFPMLGAYEQYLSFFDETPDVILVGIGYGAKTAAEGNMRRWDDTAPSTERDDWGGAADFQEVLRREVLPLIESTYHSDPARRILFGQSLGGQFVLYTALTQPDLFWGHIASNPAIYANVEFFLDFEFDAADRTDSRLVVVTGSDELPRYREPMAAWLAHWSGARTKPWELEAVTLDGHSHVSIGPAAYRHGLVRLFADAANEPHDTTPQITEQERQAAIDVLDTFAAARTRIPPSPEAYLSMLARDARTTFSGDSGFAVGYDRLAAALDRPEKILQDWVTEFDLVVHGHDIRKLADDVLMYTAYYDERIVDTSGVELEVEENVMHGTLVRQDGTWKILSMATAHTGEAEEAIAAFFRRNTEEDG